MIPTSFSFGAGLFHSAFTPKGFQTRGKERVACFAFHPAPQMRGLVTGSACVDVADLMCGYLTVVPEDRRAIGGCRARSTVLRLPCKLQKRARQFLLPFFFSFSSFFFVSFSSCRRRNWIADYGMESRVPFPSLPRNWGGCSWQRTTSAESLRFSSSSL